MGGGQNLVELSSDAESRAVPGLKVLQTPPMDEHADYDRFWDALIAVLKTGYKEDPSIKSGQFTQILDNKFEVLIVIDGAAKGLESDAAHRFMFTHDKAKGEIHEAIRELPLDLLKVIGTYKVHRDPLQLEYWNQTVIPLPRFGVFIVMLLKSVLNTVVGREVEVYADQASTKIPGLRVVSSEDLGKDMSLEQLWDGLMKLFKEQSSNPHKVGETEVVVERDDGDGYYFSVTCTVDTQKMFDDKLIAAVPPGGGRAEARYEVRASPADKVFSYATYTAGFLSEIHNGFVIAEPLRVELFTVNASPPLVADHARETASKLVNMALRSVKESS